MKDLLDEVNARADELSSAVAELLDKMKELPAEAMGWPPVIPLSDLVSRIGNLAGLSIELSRMPEDRFGLAPASRVVALRDQTSALTQSTRSLTANLAQLPSWGGASRFEASNGVLHANSGNNINLGALVGDLQTRFDGALEPYLTIASAVQPRGIGTFAAASRTVAEKATEAAKLTADLEKNKAQWVALFESAQAERSNLGVLETEARRILEEVEKARRTVDENAAKADTAASSIEEIRAQAAALESAVSGYQDAFNAFQQQLDRREASIKAGNAAVTKLNESLAEKETAIEALTARAEEMLGGATTAGLASTYKGRVDSVDQQLGNARKWYYGSIALLVLSVAVALNLFGFVGIGLPALPSFSSDTPTGTIAVQALSALGSRGLLILPALLLAGFTAHRHSALFRLREEYGHKYTAASSVQGFKTQAPTYQESIAAAVFAELLKNPAQAMDSVKKENEGNGFLDRLIMPRVEEALRRAAQLPESAK
jgi:soluble cytochrome b562